ncbi:FadR/GntR family transcriptional regulator [Effusibacillus lacus]|uniref:GntR family transcriptional regulator n=1 Tax=Effusibacillus lacus TaxID=1348429 RepID=A0A292YJU9_9BACL|nr:FadR/GntR family transcriptional regulator [Effusibacillus lacus]TCS72328.1 GntR family transcriptional regulator [Effusibacillus lacus]GAX90208.1 GntR family transcriptional regulator [Effusibacillus lacus]
MYKLKTQKVYEQVASHIQSLIEKGVYKPGDKLPTLIEMSEMLNVGRATVREAFSALQAKGLIDIRHGEGSFVRSIDLENFQEPMNIALMKGDDLVELLEVRKILEVGAAEMAARNRTEENLEEMRRALDIMGAYQESETESVEADFRFHMAVAKASGNSMLLSLIQTIAPTMQSMMSRMREVAGSSRDLLYQHIQIYKAIEAKNPDISRKTMYDHIDNTMQGLESHRRHKGKTS